MLVVGKPDEEKTFEERKAELIMAKRLRMGTAVMLNKSVSSREMTPSMYLPNGNQVNSGEVIHTKKTKMSVIVDGKQQKKDQEPKVNIAAMKAATNPIALRYWQMCNQPQQTITPNTNDKKEASSFPNYRITDQSCPPTFRLKDDSPIKAINSDVQPPWMHPGFHSPPTTKKIPVKQQQPLRVKVKTKDAMWNPQGPETATNPPNIEDVKSKQTARKHLEKILPQLPEYTSAQKSYRDLSFSVPCKMDENSLDQQGSEKFNQQQTLKQSNYKNNLIQLEQGIGLTSASTLQSQVNFNNVKLEPKSNQKINLIPQTAVKVDVVKLEPRNSQNSVSIPKKPVNVNVIKVEPKSSQNTVSVSQKPANVNVVKVEPNSSQKTVSISQKPVNVNIVKKFKPTQNQRSTAMPPAQTNVQQKHPENQQIMDCQSHSGLANSYSHAQQEELIQNAYPRKIEQRPQERKSRAPRRPPPPKAQDLTFRRSQCGFIPLPSYSTPKSPELSRPVRPQSPQIQIFSKHDTFQPNRISRPETPEIKKISRPWSPPACTSNIPWISQNNNTPWSSSKARSSSLPPWVKNTRTQLIRTNVN